MAMLTADETANELFKASLQDLTDQPFELARTELCWGESLRRQRNIPDSRTHLAAAARIFDRLDARPWAERARSELRATGARTPMLQRTVLSELTPQEMQVAVSVGQGSSNRDAAAQLFISPKTVEHHLSSIYQKLGLRSRTELALLLPTLTES
jgi:DNA-binding CsgD family transcriptional regulator